MRFSPRNLLTHLLLAVYGCIAVLGYGLHGLSPVDDHHHGYAAVQFATHAGHHHGPAPAGDWLGNSHECDVCVFLAQVRSERPQLFAAEIWQHLFATVTLAAPRITSQTTLGLHSPRGPPTLLG